MVKYITPKIEIFELDINNIMTSSYLDAEQCDCFLHRVYGGCLGCHGNCGCNHWDSEAEELVPGC